MNDIEKITFLTADELTTVASFLNGEIPQELKWLLVRLLSRLTSVKRVELPDGSVAYQDVGSVG